MARTILALITGMCVVHAGCTMQTTSVGDNGEQSMRIEVPTSMLIGSVKLTPGEQNEFTRTFSLPMAMSFNSITVDMAATLGSTQVTNSPGASARITGPAATGGEVFYRVGPASQADTVCQTGTLYGPFSVSVNENAEPMGVDPPSSELSSGDVSIINSGSFAICVVGTPVADATATVNMVALDVTMGGDDDCAAPADIAGVWSGTFSCTDSCGDGFKNDITLTITVDGNSASYVDDGDTRFSGTVCGNVFTFARDDTSFETETGMFVLNSDGSATKTSTFRCNEPPFCTGDCTDNLTRQ